MPVSVVLDAPQGRSVLRALASGVGAVGGYVLLAVALIGVWPAFALTYLAVIRVFGQRLEDDAPAALSSGLWPTWFVVTGTTLGAYVVGIRLVRSRRKVALFLRRFGFTDATQVVTAAARRIGGAWRVVTLDDREVEALGHSSATVRRMRRLDRALTVMQDSGRRLLAVGATIGLVIAVVYGVGVWQQYQDTGELELDTVFELLRVGLLVWAVVMVLLLLGVVLMPFFSAASVARKEIEKTETSKRMRLDDPLYLRATAVAVRKRAAKVISPKLIVLEVSTPIWKDAVVAFAEVATVSVVDVSTISDNVMWEIDHLQDDLGRRCLFIGKYDRLASLYRIPEHRSLEAQLQDRLDGVTVLAYTTDRRGVRRFTRALRAMLDQEARANPRRT